VVKCEICEAKANIFLEYKGINRDNEFLVKAFANKAIWRCTNCNYCFCYPRGEYNLLKQYYESNYWNEHGKVRGDLLTKLKTFVPGLIRRNIWRLRKSDLRTQTQVDLIRRFIEVRGGNSWLKGNSTLDIGAGQANISCGLRRNYSSLRAHVVEPSDEFQYIYRRYGIKKVSNTFEEMGESYRYAIISSSHWLEHVIDVHASFLKIRRLLKDDGIIFIEVPNCQDPYFKYRLFPNPPHLNFYTPKSIRFLVEKYDFQVLFLMTCGRPIEWEKDIGYLKLDTPPLIDNFELEKLAQERESKFKSLLESLDPGTRKSVASHGFQNTYSENGREFIRLIAMPNR
jgi:2-polyprenyl-3-methyl-5-hydroxy-6-metoxy-1,4-benzoquinol methylase